MEIATRGSESRYSVSSGIVSAGGEAVKVLALDMGRRDGGDDFSTLCRFSTRLCLFSGCVGGASRLMRSLAAIEFRLTRALGPMLIRSILCRTVFSSSLFFADGKYSAKWFEMSSDGGR